MQALVVARVGEQPGAQRNAPQRLTMAVLVQSVMQRVAS